MTFKEKLVKLRKLKKITQDEFACAVGVSRQAVYKWESGQSYPEVPKLIEMKHLFGISIDDLLDDNYEVVLPEKKRRRRKTTEVAAAEAKTETKSLLQHHSSEASILRRSAFFTVQLSHPYMTTGNILDVAKQCQNFTFNWTEMRFHSVTL